MAAAENGLTRKELLRLGLLGGAAMVPLGGAALGGGSAILARLSDRLPESRIPRPFQVPFTVPPVAQPVRVGADGTRFYQLTMRRAFAPILPGFPRTEIYGYDGISPGPTIAAGRGDVVIRHINRLPRTSRFGHVNATSVHLHGMATKPAYDGWADDLTAPGQYKDYVYLNTQRQRLLWYHDHAVHLTALNTYMGLAGFYLHDPDDVPPGAVAKLPRGRYMVPLMIGDKIFSKDGQLIFDDQGESSLFGDVILVNGRPWPVMRAERRKYTLGFLNASNSRAFNLALSSGDPFISVAHDSGLGIAPVEVESFRLGMAERYAMIVDFAKYRVGDQIVLENRELRNNDDFPSTRRIMRFDVVSDATDTRNNGIPEILVPDSRDPGEPHDPMPLQESQAVRTREFRFERDHGLWTVNGATWQDGRVRANPGHDDVEIWRFTNNSGGWSHPIHVHLIDFKILDRNGQPPFPFEVGRKDTVYVGEGESVRVIAKFGPHQGKYMMHCHNTVHEDHDMMIAFQIGDGGADPMSVPAKDLPAPPL